MQVAAAKLRKEVDASHAKVSWYEELFQDRYAVLPWSSGWRGSPTVPGYPPGKADGWQGAGCSLSAAK